MYYSGKKHPEYFRHTLAHFGYIDEENPSLAHNLSVTETFGLVHLALEDFLPFFSSTPVTNSSSGDCQSCSCWLLRCSGSFPIPQRVGGSVLFVFPVNAVFWLGVSCDFLLEGTYFY